MNKTYLVAVVAALFAAAPLAYAHDPAGTPKLYCEGPGEHNVHDYGPPATGRALSGFTDGNMDDCDGDFDPSNPVCLVEEVLREDVDGDGKVCEAADYDGHAEWSRGGAWILSCDLACGQNPLWPGSVGAGASACFEEAAHHAEYPTVVVFDVGLGYGASFVVAADTESPLGPDPVTGLDCGDFKSDVRAECTGSCGVTFAAGLDGSYQVYVQGTLGHVST